MRLLAAMTVLLALLSICGCAARGVPLRTTTTAPIAGAYDWPAVRAAMIRALQAQQFRVESEEGNRIIARYVHRQRMLQVAIDYTLSGYRVTYLSSAGLHAQQGTDGVDRIHPRYERIIEQLQSHVRSELDRPMREQRELQIAIARAQRPVVVAPGHIGSPTVIAPGYGGGYAAAPSCEAALAEMGHPSTTEMFCRGVDPFCARELIYGGHPPTSLMFCRDVDSSCAVEHLRTGGLPVSLSRCRY